tara:strand:- start:6644 stop:6871 length:228 start_codon:yes stop_codon:yes gene_type:complete
MEAIKALDSKINLINASREQVMTHHVFTDDDREILIPFYDRQIEKYERQRTELINSIEVHDPIFENPSKMQNQEK